MTYLLTDSEMQSTLARMDADDIADEIAIVEGLAFRTATTDRWLDLLMAEQEALESGE